jgi:hypothetical protein
MLAVSIPPAVASLGWVNTVTHQERFGQWRELHGFLLGLGSSVT